MIKQSSTNGHVIFQRPEVVIHTSGGTKAPGKFIIALQNNPELINTVKNILSVEVQEIPPEKEENMPPTAEGEKPRKRRTYHQLYVIPAEGKKVIDSFSVDNNSSELKYLLYDITMAQLERYPVIELKKTRQGLTINKAEDSVALAI